MDSFSPDEKHQSQIPALQLLVNLGFTPISQTEAERLRGNLGNVLLESVLVDQVLEINRFHHGGKAYPFDLEDAHEALRRLKRSPDQLKGLQATNQDIYDLLVLGTTITKTIEGDSKSYSFRYIDWDNPENNTFHVTAEMRVERTASYETRRCDIVGFVNGIPFLVIENKRPTEPLKKAESQLIAYQGVENIPHLFHFAQLLMSMNRGEARYATVGTATKFWSTWREKGGTDSDIEPFLDKQLSEDIKGALFSGGFSEARAYFEGGESRIVTAQDRLIYALCRPERLLDIVRRFTVFDGGVRKVARHQQYFGIVEALKRVKLFDESGARKGGVIWHTQGSGKSLTMVMLGRALALDPEINNPRLIIVTDRIDLDRQIKSTFKSCDMEPVLAKSASHLTTLLRHKTPLITTLINKFEGVMQSGKIEDSDPNLFILVDESHRGQTGRYGGFSKLGGKMRVVLPKACYLGFTGTPLMKKERNTLGTFGNIIHSYTIDEGVKDEAVVPLLYEGRLVDQQVTGDVIDSWFDKISQGLTVEQKADLKRKFSRVDALSKTEQAIRAKAYDISEHYRQHWQGTGFKAQLVSPGKAEAIKFKEILDDIGHVTSEIIISSPNEKEGNEEVNAESKDVVRRFWDRMMQQHGSESEYLRRITENFKSASDPEILIVVSKLLTGFDAPRNTVLYVCKSLKEHNLLQAIARVNRLFEDGDQEKDFGFIIDYEGLLGELDSALSTYSELEGFDDEDLIGTVHDVREQIRKLPQLHDQLWDMFKAISNKKDMEEFELLLGDEALRDEFYQRLKAYSRCLHIAMSSDKVYDVFSDKQLSQFQQDWKRFSELKRSVGLRYQESIDLKEFEPKIRKLLDDHVVASPATTIIEAVNINDPDALNKVVAEQDVTAASKADRIASATKKVITESMDKDPALYSRFSDMLSDTIRDYRQRRLSEQEYLRRIMELAQKVASGEPQDGLPPSVKDDEDAAAFYRLIEPFLTDAVESRDGLDDKAAKIAKEVISIIQKPGHRVVNRWANTEVQNAIRNDIDDFFFEVVRDELGVDIPMAILDQLENEIMKLARARF